MKSKLNDLKNLTILIIEDNEELLNNLDITLSVFFNKVLKATNGAEALNIYKNNQINMIITDYAMPIMDGFEFCSKIREQNSNIPIAIMSNYTDSNKLLNVIPLNICEYLIKPVSYDSLTAVLIKLLEKMEYENIVTINITMNIKYDMQVKKLFKAEKEISLTKNEIKVVEFFIKYKNNVISIEQISSSINSNEDKSEQAIKNLIHRLRQKLGKDNIVNVQGFGYMLKCI